MHPGRRLGAALGFVTFFAAYFLPFVRSAGEPWLDLNINQSVYGNTISALGKLSTQANPMIPILLTAGAMLIVTGGAFGVRPIAGATLGIAGMIAATFGDYLQSSGFRITSYGAGYWVLWGLAVTTLVAALWARRDERGPREAKPAKEWSK